MSLEQFAAIGEAVGGIAVLVTLIYLAYPFRQAAAIDAALAERTDSFDWRDLQPHLRPIRG